MPKLVKLTAPNGEPAIINASRIDGYCSGEGTTRVYVGGCATQEPWRVMESVDEVTSKILEALP